MHIGITQERPPYVTFELRPVEDREESIKQGKYVAKDEVFAIITPQGSKDRIERLASEWFTNLRHQVREQRFPAMWLAGYEQHFEAWQKGLEAPVNGTAIRQWPVASPAQVRALTDLRVHTVEDLAAANEETIARLGMGGRLLKQKAVDWLASASNIGKVAEEVTALRAEIEALKADKEKRETELTEARRLLATFTAKGSVASASASQDSEIDLELDK